MKNVISERAAFYGLVGILSAITIFHVLILSGIIPFQIVWGGRLENREQMLQFEMISLLLNACMLLVIGIRGGLVKVTINPLIIRILLWAMCGLFILNTLGNVLSNNTLETIIFTPLTLLLAIFSWRLAVGHGRSLKARPQHK